MNTTAYSRDAETNRDEWEIAHLLEHYLAGFTSPVSGVSMAAALIPNGESRSSVPRAVAIELLGDVAIADVRIRHPRSILEMRIPFIRTGTVWQALTPTLH